MDGAFVCPLVTFGMMEALVHHGLIVHSHFARAAQVVVRFRLPTSEGIELRIVLGLNPSGISGPR
jgi:hypothetical protein